MGVFHIRGMEFNPFFFWGGKSHFHWVNEKNLDPNDPKISVEVFLSDFGVAAPLRRRVWKASQDRSRPMKHTVEGCEILHQLIDVFFHVYPISHYL